MPAERARDSVMTPQRAGQRCFVEHVGLDHAETGLRFELAGLKNEGP